MHKPEGLTVFEKFIPPELFYPCLHQAIKDEFSLPILMKQLLFSLENNLMDRRILVYKDKIRFKRIENAST